MAEQAISNKDQKSLLWYSLVILILTILATGTFYVLKVNKQSNLNSKRAELDALKQQLAAPDLVNVAKAAETFQKGITGFQTFLNNQVAYSKVFAKLQSLTPKDVRISNLSFGEKRDLKIDGEAATLSSIAKYIAALNDSGNFSAVTLISSNQSETASGKRFNFSLNTNFLGFNSK